MKSGDKKTSKELRGEGRRNKEKERKTSTYNRKKQKLDYFLGETTEFESNMGSQELGGQS